MHANAGAAHSSCSAYLAVLSWSSSVEKENLLEVLHRLASAANTYKAKVEYPTWISRRPFCRECYKPTSPRDGRVPQRCSYKSCDVRWEGISWVIFAQGLAWQQWKWPKQRGELLTRMRLSWSKSDCSLMVLNNPWDLCSLRYILDLSSKLERYRKKSDIWASLHMSLWHVLKIALVSESRSESMWSTQTLVQDLSSTISVTHNFNTCWWRVRFTIPR